MSGSLHIRNGSWSCENAPAEAFTLRDLGDVAGCGYFGEFGGFPTVGAGCEDSSCLGRLRNSRWTHVWDDYALIAAMSGWAPMMFMTRVRL
jgi:hypothetical protein